MIQSYQADNGWFVKAAFIDAHFRSRQDIGCYMPSTDGHLPLMLSCGHTLWDWQNDCQRPSRWKVTQRDNCRLTKFLVFQHLCWITRCNMETSYLSWKSDEGWDTESAQSRTAFVTLYAGHPVIWSSKVQSEIAMSSTERVYLALTAATRQGFPQMGLEQEIAE